MKPAELEKAVETWRRDLPAFSVDLLRVLTKSGQVAPFEFNPMQAALHDALEARLADRGMIRALVLKARQMGVSTYVAARFFHRAYMNFGQKVGVMTHVSQTTRQMAGMATRFYDHLPPYFKRPLSRRNDWELVFARRESGYYLQTAGNATIGRGLTVRHFHGSEAGLWPNTEELMSGVMQSIPSDAEGGSGTEIIIESTAQGMGQWFAQMWQENIDGAGPWLCLFYPWFTDPNYRMPVDRGRAPLDEIDLGEGSSAREYAEEHGLSAEQMSWYLYKLDELKDPYLCRQEYPATAHEAFQGAAGRSLIRPLDIMRARRTRLALSEHRAHPLIIGVDPARPDKELEGSRKSHDRFAIIRRRGPRAYGLESRNDLDGPAAAQYLAHVAEEEKPAMIIVDEGGVGYSVTDHCRHFAVLRPIVYGINLGSSSPDPARAARLRDHCYLQMRDWFRLPRVEIPDDDRLHSALLASQYQYDDNVLRMTGKKQLRTQGIRSPDEADCLAFTFALPEAAADGVGAFVPAGGDTAGWDGRASLVELAEWSLFDA